MINLLHQHEQLFFHHNFLFEYFFIIIMTEKKCDIDLQKLTVKQLREKCRIEEIKGCSGKNKSQLIEHICNYKPEQYRSIKNLKWYITYHEEELEKAEKILDKKLANNENPILAYFDVEHHRKGARDNQAELWNRQKANEEKNKKLGDYLYKKYPPIKYGLDFPSLYEAFHDDIFKDHPKVWDFEEVITVNEWVINGRLEEINWRNDLIDAIERGEHPELKGKRIPKIGWHEYLRKTFFDEIIEHFKEDFKEYDHELTPTEIRKIKNVLKIYIH